MAINVEVAKGPTENNISVIKRFTRKMQESGVLPRVRGLRYASRKKSKYVKKKEALVKLERRADVNLQIKLGKMTPRTVR
jgi:ribosomal protein S21